MEKAKKLSELLGKIRTDLKELEAAGEGIPAVEKGVKRLSGTLNALEIQFKPLERLGG